MMAASFTGREQSTIPNWDDAGSSGQGLGDIFLSHSGRQKPFVERLYDGLVMVHTVFLDKYSLPVASPFLENVMRALRCCKLGVVVLSEEYLTSKWPMMELEMLFEHKKPVLPLFYRLSTEDLRSPTKLSKWQEKWNYIVENQQQKDRWTAALQELPSINGLDFKQEGNEAAYINKVVAKICKFHPPNDVYDQSLIQGREGLAKLIAGHFDKLARKANHLQEACVVALHGIGGQGKTTLCKSMVNFYNSEYFGRSYLIEFPTVGDVEKVAKEWQMALRRLVNLRFEGSEVENFDQVEQIMRYAGKFHMFLAIDNIWDHSIEAARRLLDVGFTANSKILLTSRSRKVLFSLLSDTIQKNKDYYLIDALPAPEKVVAFQIFQQTVNQGDLTSLACRDRIDSVLERCSEKNHGRYNPLAVTALGAFAASLFRRGGSKSNADSWPRILKELEKVDLEDVNTAIRLNYDILDDEKRHIFLDIAIWFWNPAFKFFLKCMNADINQWLQFYYKFDEINLSTRIHDLAAAGVILTEKAQNDGKMIHDSYVEFALNEATKGPSLLTSTEEAVEGMEWGNLRKVILAKPEEKLPLHQFEKLRLHQCQKLELLYVYGIELEHFPESISSLRVLILQWPRGFDSKRTLLNLNGLVNLEYLSLEKLPSLVKLEGQNGFPNLRMFFLRDCAQVEDLNLLRFSNQLEALVIDGQFYISQADFCVGHECGVHPFLVDMRSLGPSRNGPEVWKSWPDLVAALQNLKVSGCMALKRLPELSPALKLLNVSGCTALKRLPDLDGLTALETLWLHNNTSLVEMGAFSPALKTVIITDCQVVRLPDLASVTGLEVLILQNTGLSEVGCLSSALKFVRIDRCSALKKMPALDGMTGLETLALTYNASLEELESLSPALKTIEVKMCCALKRIPELGGVTGLESLTLEDNASLESLTLEDNASLREVGSQGRRPVRMHMHLEGCGSLTRTPDFGEMIGLRHLTLKGLASLEEVGPLNTTLEELKVEKCDTLMRLPELAGLTALTRLALISLSSLEEVGCLGPALERLHVERCGSLKRTPDLAGVTGLEQLTLKGLASLEEVGPLSPALERLAVVGCDALKRIPELAGLTGLKRLVLMNNASLEEVGRLSPALAILVDGALKRRPNFEGSRSEKRDLIALCPKMRPDVL